MVSQGNIWRFSKKNVSTNRKNKSNLKSLIVSNTYLGSLIHLVLDLSQTQNKYY
jgi:hypothetical protein